MPPAAPRRVLAAVIAAVALFLASLVGASPASATVPWSSLTIVQKQTYMANAMFQMLNSERAAYHLAPLGGSPTLVKSALSHNLAMARYNMMSHQCPGEASPGTRITQAGYHWRNWGENVGWTTNETIPGIQYMEQLMFGEKAPDNGHRLNILGNYKAIGISVYIDVKHGKMWYTQDFASPY